MISEEGLIKFQALYKKHFGIEISREVALSKGIRLLRTIELIYKPMTENDYKKLQERRKQRRAL